LIYFSVAFAEVHTDLYNLFFTYNTTPQGMYAATHGVVMANLIIDGKVCGVQGFFMQLRDENGMLMSGVEVGEMGKNYALFNDTFLRIANPPPSLSLSLSLPTHLKVPKFFTQIPTSDTPVLLTCAYLASICFPSYIRLHVRENLSLPLLH
jgi:hypothetical protein